MSIFFYYDNDMLRYLSQGGPYHPKHGGGCRSQPDGRGLPPLHPSLAFVIHYSVAIPTIHLVHDTLVADENQHFSHDESALRKQADVSTFLFIYTLILFTARYLSSYHAGRLRHHSVLYELTWLCNSTLVAGCLSFGGWSDGWLLRRRPLAATAYCVAVSIDQVMWYVDSFVWVVSGTFPIGVIKYLTWQQTLWIDRLTCTHHLWTIPLIIYGSGTEVTWDSFILSVYIVTIHVLLSRWLTPHIIRQGRTDTGDDRRGHGNLEDPLYFRYLNVNLAHELWQDITFPFLQISKDNPPCWMYMFRLLWRWQVFNALVFVGILRPLSRLIT